MKIGIIGAGASGMMAAICAAQKGADVVLIEKNDRVGKKILVTGNGKCNVSNLNFDMSNYYCADIEKLEKIFSVFSVKELITFFETNGLMIRSKNGYLYPYAEQAAVVLDFFRRLLQNKNIKIYLEQKVDSVKYIGEKFIVEGDSFSEKFDKVIVSCGGPASQKKEMGMTGFNIARKFGHQVHKVIPGLVQLRANDSFLKIMAGVRAQAEIKLFFNDKYIATEQGEIQFTDYGISGIPVFQISRMVSYAIEEGKKVTVGINFFPEMEEQEFWKCMKLRYDKMHGATVEEFLTGTVNKKINAALIKQAGLKPEQNINKISFESIKLLLKQYRELVVHITASNGMGNAQVCAGGVDFAEISTTMESLKCKGLYFTGEVVDVDGKCGGYNLQWAFTSGYIAGRSAASNR